MKKNEDFVSFVHKNSDNIAYISDKGSILLFNKGKYIDEHDYLSTCLKKIKLPVNYNEYEIYYKKTLFDDCKIIITNFNKIYKKKYKGNSYVSILNAYIKGLYIQKNMQQHTSINDLIKNHNIDYPIMINDYMIVNISENNNTIYYKIKSKDIILGLIPVYKYLNHEELTELKTLL